MRTKSKVSEKPDYKRDLDPARRRVRRRLWTRYVREFRSTKTETRGGWPALAKAVGVPVVRLFNLVVHGETPKKVEHRLAVGLPKVLPSERKRKTPRAERKRVEWFYFYDPQMRGVARVNHLMLVPVVEGLGMKSCTRAEYFQYKKKKETSVVMTWNSMDATLVSNQAEEKTRKRNDEKTQSIPEAAHS